MKKEAAELIANYLENDESIIENYSGRGMFGETTYAISCTSMQEFMMALGYVLERVHDFEYEEIEPISEWLKSGFRQDQMGLGIVIY